MRNSTIYLWLAMLGALLPYAFFAAFFMQDGLSLHEFVRQLFTTFPAGGFTVDLLITSTVFWIWSFHETRKHSMRHWWMFVATNLLIGLSCAFPLFLYFRSHAMNAADDQAITADTTST